MGLASIIYDVLDDYILHASIHKFLSFERAAALEHLKVLEDMGLYNNSIIIFDRGYYSEDMFRELYFYRWPVELKYETYLGQIS